MRSQVLALAWAGAAGGALGLAAPAARAADSAGVAAGAAAGAGGAAHGALYAGLLSLASGLGFESFARILGFGEGFAVGLLLAAVVALMILPTMLIGRRRAIEPYRPRDPATADWRPDSARRAVEPYGPYGGAPGAHGPRAAPASAGAAPAPGAGAGRLHVDSAAAHQAPVGQLGVPAGFDSASFLTNAKLYFGRLQQAWGRGDLMALQQFTSPALFTALTHELRARRDTGPRSTHVVAIEAILLGIESSSREHIASVHFSGTLSVDGGNEAIDEVWNLTRPTSGQGGWVLAGIQQLN